MLGEDLSTGASQQLRALQRQALVLALRPHLLLALRLRTLLTSTGPGQAILLVGSPRRMHLYVQVNHLAWRIGHRTHRTLRVRQSVPYVLLSLPKMPFGNLSDFPQTCYGSAREPSPGTDPGTEAEGEKPLERALA